MSRAETVESELKRCTPGTTLWLSSDHRNEQRETIGIETISYLAEDTTKTDADHTAPILSATDEETKGASRLHELREIQSPNQVEWLSPVPASNVPSDEDIECLARDIQRTEAISKVLGAIRMGELVTSRLRIDEHKQGNPNTLRRLSDALARQGTRIPASTLSRNVALYRLFREHVFVEDLDRQLSVLYELIPLEPVLRASIIEWTRNSSGVTVQSVRQYIASQKANTFSKNSRPDRAGKSPKGQQLTLADIDRQMAELTELADTCADCPEFIQERLAQVAMSIRELASRKKKQ